MNNREQFLRDILCTALEGGVGYWSTACDVVREGDYPDGDWEYVSYVLHEAADGDTSCTLSPGVDCPGHLVDITAASRGVHGLLSAPAQYPQRDLLFRALQDLDAGDIDSNIADCIVQFGVFGRVVFG